MAVRLPGDGSLSLSLLRNRGVVERRDPDGHVHLQDGQSAALGVRARQDDQRLAELHVGGLRLADVAVVVVLGVLHVLALTTTAILTAVAHQLDSVVVVSFGHVKVWPRVRQGLRQRQGKRRLLCWAGEKVRRHSDYTGKRGRLDSMLLIPNWETALFAKKLQKYK